jgi:hypothetical protein
MFLVSVPAPLPHYSPDPFPFPSHLRYEDITSVYFSGGVPTIFSVAVGVLSSAVDVLSAEVLLLVHADDLARLLAEESDDF